MKYEAIKNKLLKTKVSFLLVFARVLLVFAHTAFVPLHGKKITKQPHHYHAGFDKCIKQIFIMNNSGMHKMCFFNLSHFRLWNGTEYHITLQVFII